LFEYTVAINPLKLNISFPMTKNAIVGETRIEAATPVTQSIAEPRNLEHLDFRASYSGQAYIKPTTGRWFIHVYTTWFIVYHMNHLWCKNSAFHIQQVVFFPRLVELELRISCHPLDSVQVNKVPRPSIYPSTNLCRIKCWLTIENSMYFTISSVVQWSTEINPETMRQSSKARQCRRFSVACSQWFPGPREGSQTLQNLL
jgi:hypothetical protein